VFDFDRFSGKFTSAMLSVLPFFFYLLLLDSMHSNIQMPSLKRNKKSYALVNIVLLSAILFVIYNCQKKSGLYKWLYTAKPVLEGGDFDFFYFLRVLVRHIYDIYFNPAIVLCRSFMILGITGAFF
jgi:hypothetical protein